MLALGLVANLTDPAAAPPPPCGLLQGVGGRVSAQHSTACAPVSCSLSQRPVSISVGYICRCWALDTQCVLQGWPASCHCVTSIALLLLVMNMCCNCRLHCVHVWAAFGPPEHQRRSLCQFCGVGALRDGRADSLGYPLAGLPAVVAPSLAVAVAALACTPNTGVSDFFQWGGGGAIRVVLSAGARSSCGGGYVQVVFVCQNKCAAQPLPYWPGLAPLR